MPLAGKMKQNHFFALLGLGHNLTGVRLGVGHNARSLPLQIAHVEHDRFLDR